MEVTKAEVLPMETLALQMKSEIDTQISTAKAFPRDLIKAVGNTVKMATMNDEIAESCCYAVPRKKKNDKGEWEEVLIEGPSIRLAEIFFSNYGNIRGGKRIVNNDGKIITAQGVCHDVENNIYFSVETSKKITYKDGKTYNEDLQNLIGNAASSTAFRNAVFTVIPKALVNSVYDKCKEVIKGSEEKLQENAKKALDFFKGMGIDEQKVFSYLGKDAKGEFLVKSIDDLKPDHLVMLRGMAAYLKSGDGKASEIINPKTEGEIELPSELAMEILKFTDENSLVKWANLQTEWINNKYFQEAVDAQKATFKK